MGEAVLRHAEFQEDPSGWAAPMRAHAFKSYCCVGQLQIKLVVESLNVVEWIWIPPKTSQNKWAITSFRERKMNRSLGMYSWINRNQWQGDKAIQTGFSQSSNSPVPNQPNWNKRNFHIRKPFILATHPPSHIHHPTLAYYPLLDVSWMNPPLISSIIM